ncbi:MAG: site-2 protease family protein [bacterium]
MQATNAVFYIAIVIMSVVIHEVSHGFVAELFGDNTARDAGRLTLNPLKHLDVFGSIILPILLYLSAGFTFGWAKPVPYNPNNLSNRKWGTVLVAAAGVLANFFIAFIFGLVIRFAGPAAASENFYFILSTIVIVNIALGLFNLVPIPPLDGSKILFTLLGRPFWRAARFLETYSLVFVVVFIAFFADRLYPLVASLFHAFTGLAL